MIAFIKGEIDHTGENFVILDCNGLGYHIIVSPLTINKLFGQTGVKLYTHEQVKDDGTTLFGFLSREELNIFTRLISVTGLGPKGAMGVMGRLGPSEITLAILTDDSEAFTKCPGIGKKTAQRIILDLKDKVSSESAFEGLAVSSSHEFISGGERANAAEALVMLGYSRSDAVKAVAAVVTGESMTAEEIIKAGLRKLSGV